MIFALCNAVLLLAAALAIAYVPLSPATTLGVRVPAAQRQHPAVLDACNDYQRVMVVVGVLAAGIALLGTQDSAFIVLPLLVLLIGSAAAYIRGHRLILHAKREENWAAAARNGEVPDLPVPTMPWLGIIGSLLITALSTLYVAMRWDDIPDTVPTHFGPSLQPDAWSDKGIGSVFIFSFVSLGIALLFILVTALFVKYPLAGRNDQTPAGRVRTLATMAATTTSLGIMLVLLCIGLSAVGITTLFYPAYIGLGYGVLMAGVIVSIIIIFVLTKRAVPAGAGPAGENETAGTDGTDSPDNDRRYL